MTETIRQRADIAQHFVTCAPLHTTSTLSSTSSVHSILNKLRALLRFQDMYAIAYRRWKSWQIHITQDWQNLYNYQTNRHWFYEHTKMYFTWAQKDSNYSLAGEYCPTRNAEVAWMTKYSNTRTLARIVRKRRERAECVSDSVDTEL